MDEGREERGGDGWVWCGLAREFLCATCGVCLPSVVEAHMGLIFFTATLEPVCTFLHAITTPYAPLPRGRSNWYLVGRRNTVSVVKR